MSILFFIIFFLITPLLTPLQFPSGGAGNNRCGILAIDAIKGNGIYELREPGIPYGLDSGDEIDDLRSETCIFGTYLLECQ